MPTTFRPLFYDRGPYIVKGRVESKKGVASIPITLWGDRVAGQKIQ